MNIDDLIAKVTAEDTVIDSVGALLTSIKGELTAALAAGVDPAKLKTLSDLVDTGTAKLTAAITANTPQAPPPPPPTV